MQASRFIRGKIATAFVLIALPLIARAADDFSKNFDEANSLYDQAKYSEAEKLYSSVVNGGHYSAELFYNLGNAEFRLDKTAAAILNYERAQSLSHGNPEIAANLAYARGQTGARIEEKGWRDDIIMNFGIDKYCWLAAIAAWAAIFAATALVLKPRSHKTSLAFAAVCSAAVFGYAAFAIYQLGRNDALAIVMAKSTEARSAPADNSTLAATLPAGSRVWILETRGPWVHCRLPGNNFAWVPADSIERVRLQNS
jgi:tetratricopeptide (TPR) repeat protein